jgi:outer membrane protein OmpA-like peptidoglycan-associated protein
MLKRLLTIGALACTMFIGGNAFAQNEEQSAPEYPHYGFWSNWSIGFDVMYSHEFDDHTTTGDIDYRVWNLTHNSNLGAELLFEKELSPVWTYRFSIAAPGIFTHDSTGDFPLWVFKHSDANQAKCDSMGGVGYDRYLSVLPLGFKVNLNNWWCGYKPERRWNMYVYMGGGFAYGRGDSLRQPNVGDFGLLAQVGLGSQWKIGKSWNEDKKNGSVIFLEAVADDFCDIPNVFDGNFHMVNAMAKVGYMYCFGVTAADQEAIAQKNRLTEDYVKGLENQISSLEQDLANSKQAEQRLQNRVNQLENENANLRNQLAQASKNTGNSNDSEAMKRIKDNQENLYGMPFSIQFANNQYKVTGKEQEKLKAIADIMKSDTTVKYTVAGFCDATGSEEYNQTLSEKRANTVKDQLVKKYGVSENQLTVKGNGKTRPFGDAKYSLNRRVSFYANVD